MTPRPETLANIRPDASPDKFFYLSVEPTLFERIDRASCDFKKLYGANPTCASRAPGRDEVVGNHTDYNAGRVMAMAIEENCLALMGQNALNTIRIYSNNFKTKDPVEFSLDDLRKGKIERFEDEKTKAWSILPQAIVATLLNSDEIGGTDILVDSTVPFTGGLSSSAAYEVALVKGLCQLYGLEYSRLEMALIIQRAEYLLGKKSGLLDKLTSLIGNHVCFDFSQLPFSPVDEGQVYQLGEFLQQNQMSLYVITDPTFSPKNRALKFAARKESCGRVVQQINSQRLLDRQISFLSNMTYEEYVSIMDKIPDVVDRRRALYVLHENIRVQKAMVAIANGNPIAFGATMTESGEEAQELFQLNEDVPQLDFILAFLRQQSRVVGIRNMGGGFSPTSLLLIDNYAVEEIFQLLRNAYVSHYHAELDLISTKSGPGANVFSL